MNASVTDALQHWAIRIFDDYKNGNKSDARSRFKQVPQPRVAFVTLALCEMAQSADERAMVRELVHSVTV